nr:hypothetical protein [Spirosoma pollinicola]
MRAHLGPSLAGKYLLEVGQLVGSNTVARILHLNGGLFWCGTERYFTAFLGMFKGIVE